MFARKEIDVVVGPETGLVNDEPVVNRVDHGGRIRTALALIADESAPSIISEMPDIIVRAPVPSDVPQLAILLSEMQRHYKRPVTDEQAVEAAELACKPVTSTFDPRVLIALADDAIVGSIVMNVVFPAYELSRALYIRDLYVAGSMRRSGVGQALVRDAARLTYLNGFSALDWTTETGNTAARQMYESCGARVLSRTYYRLAREDLVGGEYPGAVA